MLVIQEVAVKPVHPSDVQAAIGPFPAPRDARRVMGTTAEIAARRTTAPNRRHLLQALEDAEVELAAYDQQILGVLARSELEVVRVITGWIVRAHLQGLRHGAELARPRVTATSAAAAVTEAADEIEQQWSTR